MILKSCKNCNKEFYRTKSGIRSVNCFCTQSCANTYNNKRIRRNFKDGYSNYRTRAITGIGFTRCNNKNCPITKAGIAIEEIMFDVDHIKGRKAGHELGNLQMLCVWCHALKTRKRNLQLV